MSERFEHPADLAILSLDEFDNEMRFARRSLAHYDRVRAKVIDSFGHSCRVLVVECASDGDDVSSHDRVRRIGQIVGELCVGRQQQQAGASKVQSANRDE